MNKIVFENWDGTTTETDAQYTLRHAMQTLVNLEYSSTPARGTNILWRHWYRVFPNGKTVKAEIVKVEK